MGVSYESSQSRATTAPSLKEVVARAALAMVDGLETLGIGSGSTVAAFVEAMRALHRFPAAAVAASRVTADALRAEGVHVLTLEEVNGRLALYIDGADEIDPFGRLIKGAGGAHTQEKRLATASERFVVIADESKLVRALGERAPVPIEVMPEAVEAVLAELERRGLEARVRPGEQTDAGNALVDVRGVDLGDPLRAELELDAIQGVVECGIFARRRADEALIARADGVVERMVFG